MKKLFFLMLCGVSCLLAQRTKEQVWAEIDKKQAELKKAIDANPDIKKAVAELRVAVKNTEKAMGADFINLAKQVQYEYCKLISSQAYKDNEARIDEAYKEETRKIKAGEDVQQLIEERLKLFDKRGELSKKYDEKKIEFDGLNKKLSNKPELKSLSDKIFARQGQLNSMLTASMTKLIEDLRYLKEELVQLGDCKRLEDYEKHWWLLLAR